MSILTQALDSCPTAFVIINSKGIIIEMNKTTGKIFGYEKDELINQKIEILLPGSFKNTHEQYVKSFFSDPFSRSLGNGRVLTGKHKNSSKIYVEVGISFFEDSGEKFGVANIVDVTSQQSTTRLLERTQEVARIGSWHLDLQTNKCYWSKMTYQIHELDESVEVFVEDGINFYAFEHRDTIQRCVEKGISDHTPWDVELKILTTSNKEKWVRAIGSPVVEDGVVVSLEGTFQDIHDQKTLKLEHSALLSRLNLALEASQIGIWEWNILTNELIWDDQMYKLYGCEKSQFSGAYDAWIKGLHPEDRERCDREAENAVKGLKNFDTIFRVKLEDDSIRYIKAIADVVKNSGGEPVKLIGANWDITESLAQQDQIRESNERYQLMAEGASVGIWQWPDVNSDENIWSEKFFDLLGYEYNEVEASLSSFRSLIHPDDLEVMFDLIESHFKGVSDFDLKCRMKTKSGEYKWFHSTGKCARDEYGKAVKMVGSIQDIHSRVLSELALKGANEELAQFAYRTSHDLKAPLIRIRGLADAALEDLCQKDLESAKSFNEEISTQAHSLEVLVNDIFDLTRAEVQGVDVEPVDIREVIDGVKSRLSFMMNDKGVSVEFISDGIAILETSKVRITQVLENLISNSIKYSDIAKENKFVQVSFVEDNGSREIVVSDNGVGIPAHFHKKSFSMFERFHPSLADGSGLGMYIVKKHIDKINGSIEFDSSDKGTTFKIKLG